MPLLFIQYFVGTAMFGSICWIFWSEFVTCFVWCLYRSWTSHHKKIKCWKKNINARVGLLELTLYLFSIGDWTSLMFWVRPYSRLSLNVPHLFICVGVGRLCSNDWFSWKLWMLSDHVYFHRFYLIYLFFNVNSLLCLLTLKLFEFAKMICVLAGFAGETWRRLLQQSFL